VIGLADRHGRSTEPVAGAGSGSLPVNQAEQGALLRALIEVDRETDQAVTRTRRRIYNTVAGIEEQRKTRRKQTGVILGASVLFITLLAPALWSSVETFRDGANFSDLQAQVYLLALMLFPVLIAAATAACLRHRRAEDREDY